MITKITRGRRVGDLGAYLHGPGRNNEHVLEDGVTRGGEVVASNIGANGDRAPAYWAGQLRAAHHHRPDIERPIWQCSIRAHEQDRVMAAGEWGDIAQEFAEQMGYGDYPWVAVKHGPDHIHVVVSRVSEDPTQVVWTGRKDRWAAQQARRMIEQTHGLSLAPLQSTDSSKRIADHQLKQGEWKYAEATGQSPVRVRLAAQVTTAMAQTAGYGRAAFERALSEQGIAARANVASTGWVSGYSFASPSAPGGRDRDGSLIWFKASQLDKQLSWSRLGPILETPRVVLPPVPSPGTTLFGKPKQWASPAVKVAQEQEWRGQVAALGQGWQLVNHQARLRQVTQYLDGWWQQRGTATAQRIEQDDQAMKEAAEQAWKDARPTAWSDIPLEAGRALEASSHGFPGQEKRITAMKREDVIRAAEKGDQDAIATITSWAGPDHDGDDLGQVVALARQSNAQLEQQAHAARMARITGRGRGTSSTAARPYQPPTLGRDSNRGHDYGR